MGKITGMCRAPEADKQNAQEPAIRVSKAEIPQGKGRESRGNHRGRQR